MRSAGAPHFRDNQVTSAARFVVQCQNWAKGIGFSELAGFSSSVGHQEYSSNDKLGNVLNRQLGRPSAPTISVKGGLEKAGFAQLFTWHKLARDNNPDAKIAVMFTIFDAGGLEMARCALNDAWCAKLELDAAQAGSSNVMMMKATIECDSIELK